LIELEEKFADDKGFYIVVERSLAEDMDPKKKAAAKKQLEEARPFYARAWVDLSCFC